jgi:Protein of Unknown function (DUF2784)
MAYRILADVVLALHLGFVLFVVLGGLLVLRWRPLLWLHVPAAVWGAVIEVSGWACPLTPLENELRRMGGEAGYAGGFVEHYLVPILYPGELTRTTHIALGALVLAINLVIYWFVFSRPRESPTVTGGSTGAGEGTGGGGG